MAQSRNPTTGQFANVAPPGTADSTAPGMPAPGPNSADCHQPLPLLDFSAPPSLCQTTQERAALTTPPGCAGPLPTPATTPMQDFGQLMGRTGIWAPPDGDAASSS